MGRKITKVYNKNTGRWETKTLSAKEKKSISKKNITTIAVPVREKTEMTVTNPDYRSAVGRVEKAKNEDEYYTLTGTVKIIPNATTIKIKCNNTVKLKNLGSYLTGNYYVASVTRTIDSGGYSQEFEVYKPDFREQFKEKKESTKKKPKNPNLGFMDRNQLLEFMKNKGLKKNVMLRSAPSVKAATLNSNTDAKRLTNTVSEGADSTRLRVYTIASPSDTLWTLAKRFYGDSSKWKELYLLKTGEYPDPLNLKVGMKIVIP